MEFREELNQFITSVNSFHPALKYTWEISETSLAFLDIKVSISGNGLCSSVHYKPTDSHSCLLYSSSHTSITCSQFLRLRCLCCDDSDFPANQSKCANCSKNVAILSLWSKWAIIVPNKLINSHRIDEPSSWQSASWQSALQMKRHKKIRITEFYSWHGTLWLVKLQCYIFVCLAVFSPSATPLSIGPQAWWDICLSLSLFYVFNVGCPGGVGRGQKQGS